MWLWRAVVQRPERGILSCTRAPCTTCTVMAQSYPTWSVGPSWDARFLVLFYKCLSCLTRRGQVAIVVCSVISNSLWPYGLQHASFPVLYCLPEHAQTHFHWFSDAIQPSHPLSTPVSSCLQSFPASSSFWMSWLFTSGGQSIGVCVLCECDSFSISPSNEYPGLISFRMDWLDLLAVQGTLKSLLLKI